jgi:hypothetical protein
MIPVTAENLEVILTVFIGNLSDKQQEDIFSVFASDAMNAWGTLKTVAAIMKENTTLKHINDKGTGTGINDILAIDRGNPYKRTFLCFRKCYYWSSYASIVEENIGCYNSL